MYICIIYIYVHCISATHVTKKIETKISVGKWSIFWGWMISKRPYMAPSKWSINSLHLRNIQEYRTLTSL